MKKLIIFVVIIVILVGIGLALKRPSQLAAKIYVAAEGNSTIAVIDPIDQQKIGEISLSIEHDGGFLPFAPHNVQASPDGLRIWVTANAGSHQNHSGSELIPRALAHGDAPGDDDDQLVFIDPFTDKITGRLPLGTGLHLAHIVFTPDSRYAYVTAQKGDKIYKINVESLTVEKEITTPVGSEPHGLRIDPAGHTAYVAMLGSKSLGRLDLTTDQISYTPLGGQAVQTGITPDGEYVVTSLYDTKQLAIFRPATGNLSFINLGNDSRGPIQMYPTPDSRFVYLADQGFYFNQPIGRAVLKIDLALGQVVKRIETGQAPHGVVISPDGAYAYVTNLLDGNVAVINTASDEVTTTINVGKEPNGITYWQKIIGK